MDTFMVIVATMMRVGDIMESRLHFWLARDRMGGWLGNCMNYSMKSLKQLETGGYGSN